MPAYIRGRETGSGKRYDVIYRRGGRYSKVEHAGTFKSQREATLRKRLVEDWLAQALNPKVELARAIAPTLTIEEAGAAWLQSRRSIGERTREEYEQRIRKFAGAFPHTELEELTAGDVNRWIDECGLAASTTREYLATLGAVLEHAGVENVVRGRLVELPRHERRLLEPPGAADTLAVLAHAQARYRPVLVLMEQTGMRVTEACGVRTDKIDVAGSRILVAKTKTGRPRWVPVPRWLVTLLEPPWHMNRQTVHNALKAGCRAATVKPFGPHMLRHRRGSLWSAQGVPPAQAAAWLGHSVQTYLTTYTHVVPVEEIEAHRLEALLR